MQTFPILQGKRERENNKVFGIGPHCCSSMKQMYVVYYKIVTLTLSFFKLWRMTRMLHVVKKI